MMLDAFLMSDSYLESYKRRYTKKSIFGSTNEIMNYEKLVFNISARNFAVDDVFG